jgi:hypothetical protein
MILMCFFSQQLKSKTAALAVAKMNPDINITAYSIRVGAETEGFLSLSPLSFFLPPLLFSPSHNSYYNVNIVNKKKCRYF